MKSHLQADVIIIGAGSAGCVLASRLSEDPTLQVLLIEAGAKRSSLLKDVPGMTVMLMGQPKTDWCYTTEPDPTLNGRELTWNAGKMMGGGSSINGLVYIRGLRRDYDEWAKLGCSGWAWNDVVPYFKRAENFQGDNAPSMGTSGPYAISPIKSPHPLSLAFVDACSQLGMDKLEDYNQGERAGAFMNYASIKNGLRSSTANTYLRDATKRKNLRVLRGTLVDKVLFDGSRATGVRVQSKHGVVDISATSEVVISAGTVQSPAILMRSGIGPAQNLKTHNIDVLHDAPEVGENLQDHSALPTCRPVNVPTYNSQMDPLNGVRHVYNYLAHRAGPLASPAVQGMAWLRSDESLAEPDVHLNWFPFGVDYSVSPPAFLKEPAVTVAVCISRPHSRGHISLRSASPNDKPIIDYQIFSDERDLATMMRAFPIIENLFQTKALMSHVRQDSTLQPPRGDALKALIRSRSGTGLHFVGTCRMGADAQSVVDLQLQVRGVSGLRVADASIMPRLISANTNAASIMVGERCAVFIKQALASK